MVVMSEFDIVYKGLNTAQRKAVDTIYGPVLVIAGPGTGKTQLLSARVAHILRSTDALPQNILCLTFTESGAANMRERLTRFIGPAAYDVAIATYHAFGSTIINRYPEYFTDLRLERPIDELGKHQLVTEIVDELAYTNPLKQLRYHIGDLISTISEIKRGLLSPAELRGLATGNIAAIQSTEQGISAALDGYTSRLPSKLTIALPLFENIQASLESAATREQGRYQQYALLAAAELSTAIEMAQEQNKTTPLTKWKNTWLTKNNQNQYVLAGELEARRMIALADVLESYQAKLAQHGLYDFDDMILRAVDVLQTNDDLRFSLQEQYQYILLDEFQDTNAAQLRLVELLTNNPASEGKPNVLAVGDDDQAIYAFQGAEASNMLDFFRLYVDVTVISLSENYRSQAPILETAANVAAQIESRLHTHFTDIEKTLLAKQSAAVPVRLSRQTYASAVAERTAVASQIAQLVQSGVPAATIAVLAPKHKYLEPLVPYLQAQHVHVSYEKRENILDARVIRQLLAMSKLVLALHTGRHAEADSFWPEVLSYDFWGFSTADIWRMSWQASDTHTSWSEQLLASSEFRHAALIMLTLAAKVETETLEYMLDALIGTVDIQTNDRELPSVRSPLRAYYFEQSGESILYETVNQLTVLRTKLREHQTGEGRMLSLTDLLTFVRAYETAGQQMLDTSPYNQSADSVPLMTVFKAKGLEFDHVFLINCDNSVWGSGARGVGNKLTLPQNLTPIRHAGATDDERLRLLYVAITRAKHSLHLTSHTHTFSGKQTESVKFFQELLNDDGGVHTGILPEPYQIAQHDNAEPPSLESLTMNWQERHLTTDTPLKELLQDRLKRYQLSPTHLTQFLNLAHAGPQSYLLGTLLRFPSAPTTMTCYGNVIHSTLEWLQNELNRTGAVPTLEVASDYAQRLFAKQPLTDVQRTVEYDRALTALQAIHTAHKRWLAPGNVAEKSFRDEGVLIGNVHMGGKIDLLQIDKAAKTITVIDYKTGKLGSDPAKLHLYTLQLYCYKLLVEGSHSYRGYTVNEGKLIFVEPSEDGELTEKIITFDPVETARTRSLLQAMWHSVHDLNMPQTSQYGDTLKDVLQFEQDLIAGSPAT